MSDLQILFYSEEMIYLNGGGTGFLWRSESEEEEMKRDEEE